MTEIEIRCPVGPRRLFAIMLQRHEQPPITDDNLIEMACSDCARTARKQGQDVARVLHRYDLAGTLVESEIVSRSDDY